MEYVSEDFLKIGYDEKSNTKKRTSFIKTHKIISAIIASAIVLIGINVVLICEFVKILSTF